MSTNENLLLISETCTCLMLWYIIVCYMIPWIWYLVVPFYLAKLAEQCFFMWYYNACPFASVDALWLMDGPKNRIVINALLIANGELELTHLKKVLVEKLRIEDADQENNPYSKIKKRIVKGILHSYWVSYDSFTITDHLKMWPDTIKTKVKLQEVISELCSRELDRLISPWEYIVLPFINDNGRRQSAVLVRIHHCLADGVSLARFLMKELPDTKGDFIPLRKFSERNRLLMVIKAVFWGPFFLANMMTLQADSSLLHGKEPIGRKAVSWSDPMDLSIVKDIKNKSSSTVNDVLVSCLAATVTQFFLKKNIKPPLNMKVALPVDLRKNMDDAAKKFENKFAIMPLQLPTGIKDMKVLLNETKKRFNDLKTSGEPFSVSLAMEIFTRIIPSTLLEPMNKFICEKTTAVMSNVPGPQNRIAIANQELELLTFWAPQRNNIGLSFSLATYANQLVVGVQSDVALLKDPDEICKEYHGQLVEMWRQVGEINQNIN